jgi:spore maturation protein CgeB
LYDREKTHSIIFVGGDVFRNRILMLENIYSKYGSRFEWFGKNKQIRGLELNELYASTKIVVGDSQPSPLYWSNRIYETLGRGGFLLHPYVDGLDTEFIDGVHLVCYDRNNIDDLFKKIDYYLEHEDEREKIRKAGHELVKTKYTYKERCKELMKNYD